MSDTPAPPDARLGVTTEPENALPERAPAVPEEASKKSSRLGLRGQLPYFRRFPELDPNFTLIKPADLENLIKRENIAPDVAEEIRADLKYLDKELLRLFRQRDFNASLHQNRYRLYQILYITLAALAGMFGALQALTVNSNPALVPWFAFIETVIALFVTFLATISGREPPLALFMNNRRAAEQLRREFFRYLTHLPPYSDLTGFQRRVKLSQRAADISRGVYPQEVAAPEDNQGGR
jgi:hypothetical protein